MQIILGGINYNGASSIFGTLVNGDTAGVLVFNPQTGAGPGEIACTVGDGACGAAATYNAYITLSEDGTLSTDLKPTQMTATVTVATSHRQGISF